MPPYPHWELLKSALATAESEEKGVQIVLSENTLFEISKIQSWQEYYGNFVVKENDDRAIALHASDILFVDNSGEFLALHLKMGKIPDIQ